MKIKVSNTTNIQCDWLVAKCDEEIFASVAEFLSERAEHGHWYYSEDWSQGGPIIEREKIDLFHQDNGFSGAIKMATDTDPHPEPHFGPTPLIAAMRCFVASRLGDEVEIPEELL